MARLSRIVIPEVAHHVTQRGNRRMPVFFSDDDRRYYLRLLRDAGAASGTRCLAWCLMENHIHRNWRAMLRHGLEAGGLDAAGEEIAEAIEGRLRTGRPLADAAQVLAWEDELDRPLAPRKPGRKPASAPVQ